MSQEPWVTTPTPMPSGRERRREAFGEDGEYGHRPAMLHSQVRQVPWVTVSASAEHTRDGDLSAYTRAEREVREQLDALGYR